MTLPSFKKMSQFPDHQSSVFVKLTDTHYRFSTSDHRQFIMTDGYFDHFDFLKPGDIIDVEQWCIEDIEEFKYSGLIRADVIEAFQLRIMSTDGRITVASISDISRCEILPNCESGTNPLFIPYSKKGPVPVPVKMHPLEFLGITIKEIQKAVNNKPERSLIHFMPMASGLSCDIWIYVSPVKLSKLLNDPQSYLTLGGSVSLSPQVRDLVILYVPPSSKSESEIHCLYVSDTDGVLTLTKC